MYFGLSEDQSFFQDNVLKFLDDNVGLDIVKSITSKADKNLQQEIHSGLTNLGYTNMLIPEEYGGLGLDLLFATAVIYGGWEDAHRSFTTWERFATYWDPPIPATMKPLTLICVFLIAVQSVNNLIIDWKNPKEKQSK